MTIQYCVRGIHPGRIDTDLVLAGSGDWLWSIGEGATLTFGGDVSFAVNNNELDVDGPGEALFEGAASGFCLQLQSGAVATFTGSSSLTVAAYGIAGYYSGWQPSALGGTINWNSTGTLDAESGILYCTYGAPGTVNQTAGTVNVELLVFNRTPDSGGAVYHLDGGELQVCEIDVWGAPGYYGTNTLDFGGGTLTAETSFAVSAPSGHDLLYTIDEGATALIDTGGYDVTLPGVISGEGGLEKLGTGTLTLTGANTYTGGTVISSGTLQLGDGTTDGSVTGNITDNAALVFDNTAAMTFDGTIGGAGSLTKNGPDTVRLTGELSYTGGTTVDEGTLLIDRPSPAYVEPTGVGTGEVSAAGVRYGDGDVLLTADDLGLGTTRTYTAQATADLGAGFGWQLADVPYVTEGTDGTIVVAMGQEDAYWFAPSGGGYAAEFGASQTLTHDATNHVYKFADTDGTVYEFDDFSYSGPQAGQFRKSVAPSGDVAAVTSWTAAGKIAEIQYTLAGASAPYESHQCTYYGTGDPNAGVLAVSVQNFFRGWSAVVGGW